MDTTRQLTPLDRFLNYTQRALDTVFGAPGAQRPNPSRDVAQIEARTRKVTGAAPGAELVDRFTDGLESLARTLAGPLPAVVESPRGPAALLDHLLA